jgi:hypothetical protein
MSGIIGTSHSRSKVIGRSQDTAKVWVNFTGDSFGINSSYNISSMTDGGEGKYTANFAVAMSDTNYAVCLQSEDGGGFNDPRVSNRDSTQARTVSSFGMYHWHLVSDALDDATLMNLIVFGS